MDALLVLVVLGGGLLLATDAAAAGRFRRIDAFLHRLLTQPRGRNRW